MLPWTLFEVLLTPVAICRQRLWLEDEIVQYFQNYKYQDVNQDNFKKPLQVSTNAMRPNNPKKPIHFHGSSNLQLLFTFKLLQLLHCLYKINRTIIQPLKRGQNSYVYGYPLRINSPFKIFKNYVFFAMFFRKTKKIKHSFSYQLKIWAKIFQCIKI